MIVVPARLWVALKKIWMNGYPARPTGDPRISSALPMQKQRVMIMMKPKQALRQTDHMMERGSAEEASLTSSAIGDVSIYNDWNKYANKPGRELTHVNSAIETKHRGEGGEETNHEGCSHAVPATSIYEFSKDNLCILARRQNPEGDDNGKETTNVDNEH